jgi:hypothetical protein
MNKPHDCARRIVEGLLLTQSQSKQSRNQSKGKSTQANPGASSEDDGECEACQDTMWTRKSTAHDELGTCVLPSEACPISIPAWMLASLFGAVYRTLTVIVIQRVVSWPKEPVRMSSLGGAVLECLLQSIR